MPPTESGNGKNELWGMCYHDNKLYAVELVGSLSLAAYQVHGDSGGITLQDRLELQGLERLWPACKCTPHVERNTRRVFLPLGTTVIVAHLFGDKLLAERVLTGAKFGVISMDAMSPDIIYVCAADTSHRYPVHTIDVREDRITSTLKRPRTVRGTEVSNKLAVLGDNVIVVYTCNYPHRNPLVIYRHGHPAPVRVIHSPVRLQHLSAVDTDWQHNLILTERAKSVFIVDVNSGNLRHTIHTDSKQHIGCV